ncbi:uncharacterized protein LOC141703497 [Apium graveolens]|uniref:uncharacterized protein LOC141703497 n=1 Tax=Apium graveolens TaxID=4045 RepID=UPI003D793DAD
MGELKHFFHEHKLILNEAESVVSKDVDCAMCRQPINKLIDAFYTCNTTATDGCSSSNCAGFFLHKTCSELPSTFTHPMIPQHPLSLIARPYRKQLLYPCNACGGLSQGFMYVSENRFFCLKCVASQLKFLEDRILRHQGHKHPLTLVQTAALLLCHACNTTAIDLSYICTICSFWMHKSCADAPITYQCKYHNQHTLILAYSLPQEYRKFYWNCGVCSKIINPVYWVYYCANCRFFAHLKCAASSSVMLSESNDDEADSGESKLMQFPAHDKESLYKMMQQCIMKATNALHNSATTTETSPHIDCWGHEHQLELGNKLEDTELLICNGCTKPISLVNEIFYECNSCNYFLHRSCAQFPKRIEHHLAGNLVANKLKEFSIFKCGGCLILSNGIFMFNETAKFDIGCASLPRTIKHKGHRHPLNQLKYPDDDNFCKACWSVTADEKEIMMYGCEKCGFYIHTRCALRPHLVKHRWDPHPLYLILFPKNVADHPHEFDCEFCSEQINPNAWFYHCNACDLSFHGSCIDPYYRLSNVKFGATNISSEALPHQHGLTMILNKKKQRCKICGEDVAGLPVLECSPCKYVVHTHCFF